MGNMMSVGKVRPSVHQNRGTVFVLC